MPPWLLKAAVQGTISFMPASHSWNFLFQKYVTKGTNVREGWFSNKLDYCHQHLLHYQTFTQKQLPNSVMELGTGWHPIVPLAMYLCGVPHIYTIDISSLLYLPVVKQVVEFFVKFADTGQLTRHLPLTKVERIPYVKDLLTRIDTTPIADLLKTCNITSIIGDARQLSLGDIDLFVSNNTLEHIPGDTIRDIFIAFKKQISSDGIMSHLIDLSDHYSHFDKTITPYHFLRFDDNTWRLLNNHLHYQSRLRVSDYRDIHTQAGFTILHEENQRSTSEAIQQIKTASRFAGYSADDLAVIESWMVSKAVSE